MADNEKIIMPTLETLRPCPFCGGPAKMVTLDTGLTRIMCAKEWPEHVCCEIHVLGTYKRAQEDLIKEWNTRVPEDAIRSAYVNELLEQMGAPTGAESEGAND